MNRQSLGLGILLLLSGAAVMAAPAGDTLFGDTGDAVYAPAGDAGLQGLIARPIKPDDGAPPSDDGETTDSLTV